MSVLAAAGPQGAWAWAGLRLEPEPALAASGAHVGLPESQRRVEAAALEQVWLSQHWCPDGRAFELRYLGTGSGHVACTLLCRMHGPDAGAATAAVRAVRDALTETPRHVRAEPIEDTAELHAALVPFAGVPAGLAEVRRRISWAWLERRDADFPLGVAVNPLAGEPVSWEPVWEALARAGAGTVLGVCLEPYAPGQDLLGYLRLLAGEYGRLAGPGTPNPVFRQYVAPDPFAQRAAGLYQDALRRCAGRTYRMRISLAAEAAVPTHCAELLAATVSPAAAPAAAAVARTVPPQEAATAWTNTTGLHRSWLDATYRQEVPQPLGERERVLADLVDLEQAGAAFRFPYEVPGRPPLFATAARGPATAARGPAAPDRDPAAPNGPYRPGADPHAPTFHPVDPPATDPVRRPGDPARSTGDGAAP